MKRHLKLLSLLLLCSVITSAQAQYLTLGVTGNIGFSKMYTKSDNFKMLDYKDKYTPSGNLGLFHEIQFNQSSAIGIEMLFVQIEGKEVAENFNYSNTLHASYLGVPVYYRHAIGKIGIKGGFQPLFFFYASSIFEQNDERESKKKDVKLHKIDFGPKIGLDYQLNKSLRLRADYYFGLNNTIPAAKTNPGEWIGFREVDKRSRQITLGIQYVFYSE